MSNVTKCDRCGGYYEQGGKNVRQGWGSMSDEYDLCPDCAESFDAWLERGQMADTSERVTNKGEMLHDTGVSGYRYHIISDGMMRMVVKGSDLKDTDVVESVEEPDTREKLEAEMAEYLEYDWYMLAPGLLEKMSGWLDRQAAITEREFFETACHGCERLGGDDDDTLGELKAERDELAQRIQTLEREIATLKEHRAANMEKLHELTDECAELRKYRDEWKGIAEAAWAEREGYRAKLGAVLDAIREAERAAR